MLLSCPLCCKPHFDGVNSLRTTLVSVATSPLTCPMCKEVLMGLDKLTIHLFRHVNDNSCVDVENQNSDSISANVGCETNENRRGEDRNGVNNVCQEPEIIPSEVGQISNKHETPPPISPNMETSEETVACNICSFTFSDKNILEMHQKLLHQTIPDQKTGQYSYHCHLCSKKFRMRGSLMVHLRVAHYGFSNHIDLPPHLINNNRDGTKNIDVKNEMDVDTTEKGQVRSPDCKQWSCDVCAKMFTTKYFLKKHKRLHTGEMPYSCNICNKSFTFQQSYHKHMLYHSSEKPYVCNECGRAFKEHSTLQNHIRIHSGERPFGCEICGKRFRQRVSYLVHMRIHTGVMPYKCTACNKSFRYKVSQKSHKCPMNPPGIVIRVAEPEATIISTSNDRALQDNLDKGKNENYNALTQSRVNNIVQDDNKSVKCIMSVDYDTGNINLIPRHAQDLQELNHNALVFQEKNILEQVGHFRGEENQHTNLEINGCTYNDSPELHQDVYTMVLPILPQVESLCLNNSPVNQPTSPIEVIREKCLEELFQ